MTGAGRTMAMTAARRCWAEIDLDALRANAAVALASVGPGCRLIAVVKADAYGHGMVPVARALVPVARLFGVANLGEALKLRAALPDPGIFILGAALPDERERIVQEGFEATLSTLEEAVAYGAVAERLGRVARVHFVVDTGMGRMGFAEAGAAAMARRVEAVRGVAVVAVATHLPVADEDEAFTGDQLARFGAVATVIGAPPTHALNSAGIIRFGAAAGGMVRAGLMLYGSSPLPEFQGRLRPVMAWKTRITLVREIAAGGGVSYGRTFIAPAPLRVATLAVGYADGYSRHLSNRGAAVLVGGRRCPVLGRVTMDQIMVDVTAVPGAGPGDEAVLIGRQGGEEILAGELAARAGTIAWEIFTGIKARVERVYSGDG